MNSAIILAAGRGSRMGLKINKQYLNLKGKPILRHTLDVFFASPYIDEIILVINANDKEICDKIVLDKIEAIKPFRIVFGGKERQDSVGNGLDALSSDSNLVLIHDGARPFITLYDIEKLIIALEKYDAVTLGVPVKETIKVLDEKGFVKGTPPRDNIWITQTPQGFKRELIRQAHEDNKNSISLATDDSMLVENLGYKVKMIEGSYKNIKITTREDLILAESILEQDRV